MSNDTTPNYGPRTLAIHAGYSPEATTLSRAVPIYQTTSFQFKNSDHAAALFSLAEPGNIYTRIMNPTTDVFEQRVAALEGGVGALAAASGQAATTLAIITILKAGGELVAGPNPYSGTYNLFKNTLPRLGINVRFAETEKPADIKAAITDRTRAIFVESIGNPRLLVVDLEGVAAVAKEAKIPLIVDNTVASPVLLNPIKHGANIVIHSATKYIGGHGAAIGGVIVDGGNFDWSNGKFPEFTEPNPSYHGLKLHEALGNLAFILRARIELLRDTGAALAPFNAHAFITGLETIHLRVERHAANALALAKHLSAHPKVSWVRYPGLETDPAYETASRYLKGGFGGLLTFGVKGGYEASRRVSDGVKLFSMIANIGDTRSLIIHPASTTHQQLTVEQRAAAGVTEDLVRLSVGLEDIADIKDDLDRALDQA